MKKIYQIHVLSFVFAFFLGGIQAVNAANYSWNGAISNEWGNPSNWSPAGVPGTLDNVTINSAAVNQPVWEENPGIQNLTLTNGTLDLAGFTISITGTCVFTGGTVTNGTLSLTGASVTFTNTTFNANVIYSGNRFLLNGGTFNGTVSLTKTGGGNDACNGGCTFNNTVSIINNSTSYIYLENTTASTYNQAVVFSALGNGALYPARTAAGTQYKGNITVNSTGTGGVRFGQSSGTSSLAIGKTIVVGASGFTNGELDLRGLTQIGTTAIVLTGSSSGRVRFEPNSTFNGKVTCSFPFVHLSGSTFNDTLRVTKTGSGNISGNGGCTFNAPVYITKNNSGNLMMGDVSPDIFNANLYLDDQSGTGSIMVARTAAGNQFNGNIYINMNATGINFGNNGGTSTLASTKTIQLWNDGCTAGTLGFRYFTQLGTTPLTITQTTGTATFAFQLNSVFNAPITIQFPNLSFQGTTFNNTLTATKVSASNNTSVGGNIFNGVVNLNVNGNGSFTMSSTLPDIFNDDLYIDNNSTTGSASIGVTGTGNEINADLFLNNTSTGGIGFGSGGGTTIISASSNIAFFNNGFTAGPLNLRGVTRLGTDGLTLTQSSGSSTIAFLLGTEINGPVTLTYPNINLDRATINGDFTYTKGAATANSCSGGCTFNGNFTFNNPVAGQVILGNTYADIFNGTTTISQTGNAIFYLAHTAAGNQFNGNLILNSSGSGQGIRFGQNNGSSTLADGYAITAGVTGLVTGSTILRNFTQTGNTAQTLSQTTGTSLFRIEGSSVFNGNVDFNFPQLIVNGGTFNGITSLRKNGAGNNTWTGATTFNNTATIINAGTGWMQLATTSANTFNAASTFSSLNTGILYVSHTVAGSTFNGNIQLNSTNASGGVYFGQSGGTSTLAATYTISAGTDGISAGSVRLRNFTQAGGTAQVLNATGTTTTIYYESGSTFNGAVTTSAPLIYLNGTTFASTLGLTQTGAAAATSSGGCTFTGATTLTNSGTATWTLGNTTADIFQNNLTVNASGVNAQINLAHTGAGNQFNGNIVLNSYNGAAGIRIGNNNGTSTLAATKTISVGGSGFSAGSLRIRNLTQVGATAQTLNITGASASFYLESGNTFNGAVTFTAPQFYVNGTTFQGTTRLEQTGAFSINCSGGNTYGGATTLVLSGTANWTHSNVSRDIYNSTLTAQNTGSGILYLAQTGAITQFNGNVTFLSSGSSQGIYIGQGTGTARIASGISFSSTALGFTTGSLRIRNTTQLGTAAHSIILGGATSSLYFQTGNTFTGTMTATAPQLYLNGSTFAAGTYTQNGSTSISSSGANTFNGATTLVVSGSGSWTHSNTSADIYNSTLSARNTGSGVLYLAQTGALTQFNGNVTFLSSGSSQGIRIGQGTGTARIASGVSFTSTAVGFTSGSLYIRNVTQLGTTAHSLIIGGTTNAIYLQTGNTFTGTMTATAPQLYLNGSTFAAGTFTQNGGTGIYCNGGNTFNGATTLNVTGAGSWIQSNTTVDTYNSTLALNCSGAAAVLYLAHNGVGTTFNGTITMSSTGTSGGIRFGQGTNGSSTLTGTASLALGTFTSGSLRFRRFVQTGTAAITLSNTTANVQAYMETGTVFAGTVDMNFNQFFLNGGTFNGTTTLRNNGTATVGCTGGNVFNGTTIINSTGTGEWRLATTTPDDYNGNVTFRSTTAARLYPAYSTAVTFAGDVSSAGSTTLITYTLAGSTTGRLVFDGSGAQAFNADAGKLPVVVNLELNKSAGTVTPNFSLTLTRSLILTSGTMTTTSTNLLILNDNVTATGASNSSYINGPMRKIGNDAFTFPVGKVGYYRAIQIAAPAVATDHFTAEYFMSNSNGSYSHSSKDGSINHISTNEYWILNRTGGSSNVVVTLSWDNAVSGGINNTATLQVVRWNGTTWKDHGNGGIVGSTIATSGAVTSFSPFTMASQNTDNPLPVELLSFKAEAKADQVELDWNTASEVNNHFFTVERSVDLITYEEVARVTGAGNSNAVKSYQTFDTKPLNGISYYRLVQTDFDGTRREYDPQMVQFAGGDNSDLQVYPNPVVDNLSIKLPNAKAGNYTLNITDATGALVGSVELKNTDLTNYEINLKDQLPGIYTIQILNDQINLVKRVVKR